MKIINPNQMNQNVFDLIGNGWPLLCAEHGGKINTMTVSWGQMGVLWNKNVATVYVRPQRFTFPIIDNGDNYSLCLMGQEYKDSLAYCGKVSGRDQDKIAHCGFTVAHHEGIAYFKEADTVILCKKLHGSWLTKDGFVDGQIPEQCYSEGDFHKMFVGEIMGVLEKE